MMIVGGSLSGCLTAWQAGTHKKDRKNYTFLNIKIKGGKAIIIFLWLIFKIRFSLKIKILKL